MDVWVFVHNELTTIPLSITKIERTTNETRNKRDGNDDRCLDPSDGVCDIIMLLIANRMRCFIILGVWEVMAWLTLEGYKVLGLK